MKSGEKTDILGKWETSTMARNTEKHAKLETHTVEPGICRENWKNEENVKHTL